MSDSQTIIQTIEPQQVIELLAVGPQGPKGDTGDTSDLLDAANGDGSTHVKGAPVYLSAAGTLRLARADNIATADVIALVFDTSIVASALGAYLMAGKLTATTAQWDAITGQTGGLTPLAYYYLDPTMAGRMTTVAPTAAGQVEVILGVAQSATVFLIRTRVPTQL